MWSPTFIRACALMFMLSVSLFAVRPMVSYRALELGASASQIGWLAVSFGVLSFAIAIPAGKWADRIRAANLILTSLVLMLFSTFSLYFIDSLFALGFAQAMLGATHLVGLVALQKLVAGIGNPLAREARFGYFALFASIGQFIGPALAGILAAQSGNSPRPVFLLGSAVLIIALAGAISLRRTHSDKTDRSNPSKQTKPAPLRLSVVRVFSLPSVPHAIAASIVILVAIDLLLAYMPVFGDTYGLSVLTVGTLLSVRAGASALSRLFLAPIVNKFGRKNVFVLSLLVPGIAVLHFPVFPTPLALGILMFIAGFGLGFGQPMSVAFVSGATPVAIRGVALGIRLSGNRAGQVVLPALVAGVAGAGGVSAVFFALGALMVGTSGFLGKTAFINDEGRN